MRWLILMAVTLTACPKKPRHRDCFDVEVGENSAATNALFEARHCQGGGVTWAPIVRVLAGRHGRVAPVEEPIGWNGGVYLLNGKTIFSIDEEGDASQFCADDPELIQSMKREIHHLNTDVEALKQAMAAADPEEMECFDGETKLPPMNALPAQPPGQLAQVRAKLLLFQETIKKQPTWCLPHEDGKRETIRFLPNGHFEGGGSWIVPRLEMGDDRVQVISPAKELQHLDVGATGKLGWEDVAGKRTELQPGACPR